MKRASHRQLRRLPSPARPAPFAPRSSALTSPGHPQARRFILAGSIAALATLAGWSVALTPARAASLTWDGLAGDGAAILDSQGGLWANGLGYWNHGTGDTVWNSATPDDATLGGGNAGTAGTIRLGSTITAGSLTFAPPFAGLYTIHTAGFALTLNSGITANESANLQSGIGGSLILGASNDWSVALGKTLTVAADIGESAVSTLTKSGAGTLVLRGAGNFTGGTTLNVGVLQADHASALGTIGNISFGGGALQYTPLSASGTDISARIKNSNAAIALDTNGQKIVLAGNLDASNTGGLSKTGMGTLVLGGANSFTGDIHVSEGILVSTGAISGSSGLSKSGDGLLILRGTSTYTGVTTLNGGVTLMAPTAGDGAVLGSATAGNHTIVNSGATLAYGPDAFGAGGIGGPAEAITINGNGFRNQGAMRGLMGANTTSVTGVITMGSAARLQNDLAGTFQLTNSFEVSHTLAAGGTGFVQITGLASGSSDIHHYGLNGFKLGGVGVGQTYSGTIHSSLGEIRADTGNATLANTPYHDLTALNLKDSWLRLAFGTAAGAPTAGDTADSRFSTTAPISMSSSAIFLENSAFSTIATNFFDYAVAQGFGVTTIKGGNNRIGFRSADTGSVTLTFADILKPNPGTTLELHVDSLVGAALGTTAKHRIINTALETAAVNVPFVGGWAYSAGGSANPEFVKYNPVGLGGFGYTPLVAGDYVVDTAQTGWLATDHVKLSAGGATLTGNRSIQSLNMQNATGRVLTGNSGTVLEVGAGGLLTSGGTHTISVPFLTAGAASNYELYDIAWSSNIILSEITDNGANPVSFVKTGGGTTSFRNANSYTGTTYINEGVFRGVIGSVGSALGSGNLTFSGSPNLQAIYETDNNFARALGTGAGQVQFLGGGGVGGGSTGFSAFGAPVTVNLGGAGATVIWGTATFDPGIFTLNGGNATQALTLINGLDLGGEQRYLRLDGGGSGTERGAIGIIAGEISNGSLVKRGGGTLLFETPKSYDGGTIVSQGQLWLRGTGSAGANVTGNDIQVAPDGFLRLEAPSNIGSRQIVILQNTNNDTPTVVSFGAGYGTGSDLVFNSFAATGGIPSTGGNNIFIANNQSGQARRVAVTLSHNHEFQADVLGQILAVAPNVEAWFGADNGNGTFTGSTLSPSGGAVTAYRLGGHTNTGGTLTIRNANVLTGAFPLIVGAPDATDRNYTDGTIYLPQAQNYSGQNTIGQGGILHAGTNGALSTGNSTINLRGGELRLDLPAGTYGGITDSQYASRILDIQGANATLRTTAMSGGGFNRITLDSLNFPETGADRALVVGTLGTIFTDLQVNTVVMPNAARNVFLDVGGDNSFQAGAGMLTVTGVIADQPTGAQALQKRNGGVLILNADNTYDGNTLVQQGRLVLTHVGAAGSAGSSLQFATNNDRTSQIEFRLDGAGAHTIANATMTTGTGGNDGSDRLIAVGPATPGTENATIILPALTIAHAGAYTVGSADSSAVFFDGFNGYRIEIPSLVLGRDINLRTRGALTTVTGVLSGAAGFDLEKHDQGTLVLNGNNTYLGTTTISNGYLIAGSDSAFGLGTSDITFRNNIFTEILASGVRTISRYFVNSATGSAQTLGGLDAGAKLFTGNVNLSTRGLNLSSFAGGDVTFSGVIAGGFGIDKQGNGTVILNPATGTGNTYTGTTTVTQGTLIGQAQATSGSPFGTNTPFAINDGILQLNGLAAPLANSVTSTTGDLTVSGGARLVVNDTAADTFSTELNFNSLIRSGSGTLTLVAQRGDLGGEERITFTNAPALVNTIVGPFAVRWQDGTNNAADYVSMSGSSVVSATYGGSGNLDLASGGTQVFNAGATGGTLTGNRSVFAVRTDANVDLGGFTLNLGDLTTPANGGGMILNGGADLTGAPGSKINIGQTTLFLYADDAASSTLGVPITNVRNNANNTLAPVLVKFGSGTLDIGVPQMLQGNIELNRGTLNLTAANVFPLFENLNALTGGTFILSPGTSIVLNNHAQEFGGLASVNPSNAFQFSAGTVDLGTASLTVGRNGATAVYDGQLTGGVGSTLRKLGGATLTLSNINGNRPNSLASLYVYQGAVASINNDQSWATPTPFASSIPSSTEIHLQGGTWQVRTTGDSTGNQQRIAFGNNIVAGGGDSALSTVRDQGGGSNKLLTFGSLTLGVQRFLTNNDNNYVPRIDGTTTLTNHARVQTDGPLVLAGTIHDGGRGFTLNKIGGSDLSISADNSGTWSGGVVITGGTLLFANRGTDDIRYPGTTIVPLGTANAGTGDIIVNIGSAIRLTAPSNVLTAQGQEVRVYGSERGATTRVDLLTDAALPSYGLRSLTDGSLALGVNEGHWTTPLNMARIGNGGWGLSALSNTYYTATTLGASDDNEYNFGGTNAGTLSIVNSKVITGTASVELGKNPIFAGTTPAGAGASVRFYGDQDYTGNTTIFRVADAGSIGALLEITGDSASPVFDVYGRLTVRGDGRLTDDAGAQANTVNLRPGGNLRLDYNMDVADNFIISRLNESNLGLESDENKYGDATALILDGAGINLINSPGRVNKESVGVITVKGGAGITLERNGTNGQIILSAANIVRSGQSTLTVRENANELGSINLQSMKLFNGATPTLTNGIVAPWMINATRRTFLSYNAETGYTNAPFVSGTPTAGGGDAFLTAFTGTETVQFSGGWGDTTLTGPKSVYALRVDEESGTNDMVFTGGQINLLSGGLIAGSDDTNRVNFDTTAVYFGNGTTPIEGLVYGGHSSTVTRFGGVVTAADLTLDGPGQFQLTNTANAISGTIQMNGGTLYIDGNGAQGTAHEIVLHANYANNFNGGEMPSLRLRHNSATTNYTGLTVTVGENVPLATIQGERFSGTGTTTAVQFGALKILGTTGPAGTMLNLFNSNSNTDVLGTTTIGGTSDVGMNVNANTWRLVDDLSSAAQIVKTGDGVLRFDGDNSGFTGGFTLRRGEWRLTAANTANLDVAGTGDVSLDFGTVRLATNGASSVFTAAGQDLTVNGQVTLITDRNGGATAATRTIGVNNAGNVFRTNNSPYLIFQAASFGDDIVMENQVVINDSPVFRTDSADLFLRDVVSGGGTFNKGGIWYLHFDHNAANTWSGGFNNFTGVTTVRQANATLGTGPVQVFAGTGLSIGSTAQLGATGFTNIFTSGAALPVIGTRSIGNFDSITVAVAAAIRGTGNGVLSIDANQSLATDPLLASRDGGKFNLWNLGGGEGNGNLTANAIAPWGVGGAEFRIGGGSNTLTLNPAAAGSDQFSGAANKMIIGVADTVMGYGSVTFGANGNNSYGGGTLVTRARNLDGGYRGTVLSVQGGAVGSSFMTPLGTGQVDVFGDARLEGSAGTAATTGGSNNANAWVLHAGSRLRFDNGTPFAGTGGGGRWGDNANLTLNSAVLDFVGDNTNTLTNREEIGNLTVAGGAEIVVRKNAAGFWAELVSPSLNRSGSGTLMLRHDAGNLGVAGVVDANRLIITSGAGFSPGQVLMNNNMVDPWIVSRSENQFLKYDGTLGFQLITQGGAPANYLASTATTIDGSVVTQNNGSEILSVDASANVTLGANLDLHALRVSRDINTSADNAFTNILIRSGGLIQSANTPTVNANLYFGASGSGDGEALIWANNNTLQINGKIFASQVTKSGTAFLSIRSDQPQLGGNWVVNGGGLQFLTPGAQGFGEIFLNGAHMTDNDNTLQTTEVRYNFNSGTPDLFTWNGGKITVNGLGIVRSVAANDRLDQLPAIDLKTSGGGHEGIVFLQADASRHTMRTGPVTLHDHYMLSVDATSFGPGSTSGVQLGSGNGTGGLNNQGSFNVRVSGDGILSLGDNSASFTGNQTFSVGDGTVRVLHNGAFGASTVTASLRSTGAMEIAVPNFLPTATVVQEPGSIERWAVSDARGTGNYTLPNGVHLQLFTDVTGTRTIDLAGGAIMGYLPLDFDELAVIQTIRSGVTVNLTADSFLGQINPAGLSNGSNHFIYDMGKLNTSTNLNPSDVGLRGSYLVIDGNITGNFDLTKVGQDVIKLAGANSFGDLKIDSGIIQLGRHHALAASTVVSTRGSGTDGILDLNGYNLEIAGLTGPSGSVNNSGFAINTLTVNNAAPSIYDGQINGSITLHKKGAGTLTLTGVNPYQGGTILEAGTLSVAQDASLGRVHLQPRVDSLRFTGGTLQTTANLTIAATRGITLDAAGGTVETAAATTLTTASVIAGSGGLTKTGTGTMIVAATNDYTGPTTVAAGTLGITGSITGTTGLALNGGTLLLSAGSERVNDHASVALSGGTLAFASSLSGATETLGALMLNANSTIDFGAGDTNTFLFSNLSLTGGSVLSIYNWTGNPYVFNPPEDDLAAHGHLASQDRLLFGSDVSGQSLTQIQFFSDSGTTLIATGAQINFGGNYEIVPVPEPSSTALLGAAGLLALGGFRRRRRLQEVRGGKGTLS